MSTMARLAERPEGQSFWDAYSTKDTECVCGSPIPANAPHAYSPARGIHLCTECTARAGVNPLGLEDVPQELRTPEAPATSYWRTIAAFPSQCDTCQHTIPTGRPLAFRYEPKSVICLRCADLEHVPLQDSKRYLRQLGQEQQGRRQ